MRLQSLFIIFILALVGMVACKKKKVEIYTPYIEPADLRVGMYKGMFQECGPTVCYDKDTTFQITKENNRYYVLFGNHKDEIEYSTPIALEFNGVAFYALDSSGNNFASILSGYCRNDSAFVKFANGWGVDNNNLLSGKKQ
jgi:hypothetical protein